LLIISVYLGDNKCTPLMYYTTQEISIDIDNYWMNPVFSLLFRSRVLDRFPSQLIGVGSFDALWMSGDSGRWRKMKMQETLERNHRLPFVSPIFAPPVSSSRLPTPCRKSGPTNMMIIPTEMIGLLRENDLPSSSPPSRASPDLFVPAVSSFGARL
jgi:hypothetical protein